MSNSEKYLVEFEDGEHMIYDGSLTYLFEVAKERFPDHKLIVYKYEDQVAVGQFTIGKSYLEINGSELVEAY